MEITLSHFVAVVTILLSAYPGNTEMLCDFDRSCLHIYNNMKGIYEEHHLSDMASLCSLAPDLKDCMKKTSRRCRGDLNYHFFEKLVRDLNANIGVSKNCAGGLVKGSGENGSSDGGSNSSGGHSHSSHEISHHNHHGRGHGRQNNRDRGSSRGIQAADRCAPKVAEGSPTVGCALFGLTNLKSFSETLNFTDINYCSLAGAWSLIDTPEFAVQITNKGGLSPLPKDITATTLVTVIIKSNQCSERKTYQATFDEVPGMFSDGYTTAGNVYIETITESEHVKIHFPYLRTTIDVIKVLDKIPIPSLTVAVKMPESLAQSFISEPKKLRGLPLCFYGCPRTATMKPRSSSTGESTVVSARSASSSHSSSSNYYKSTCPSPIVRPSSLSSPDDDDEKPQSDSSSVSPSVESPEFSGSLSAEFLSQGDSTFANSNSDFGGQRSQRSSSATTAVICASLNSVHHLLGESKVIGQRLSFPGEENLSAGSPSSHSSHQTNARSVENFANVMNSALTSKSASVSRFHFLFVHLPLILLFTWR